MCASATIKSGIGASYSVAPDKDVIFERKFFPAKDRLRAESVFAQLKPDAPVRDGLLFSGDMIKHDLWTRAQDVFEKSKSEIRLHRKNNALPKETENLQALANARGKTVVDLIRAFDQAALTLTTNPERPREISHEILNIIVQSAFSAEQAGNRRDAAAYIDKHGNYWGTVQDQSGAFPLDTAVMRLLRDIENIRLKAGESKNKLPALGHGTVIAYKEPGLMESIALTAHMGQNLIYLMPDKNAGIRSILPHVSDFYKVERGLAKAL